MCKCQVWHCSQVQILYWQRQLVLASSILTFGSANGASSIKGREFGLSGTLTTCDHSVHITSRLLGYHGDLGLKQFHGVIWVVGYTLSIVYLSLLWKVTLRTRWGILLI